MTGFRKKKSPSGNSDIPQDSQRERGTIILGCPRSGTTMLRRLLDGHPEICCPGETMLFRACAGFFEHDLLPTGTEFGVLGALESTGFARSKVIARIRDFACSFYDDITEQEGKRRWVAKTATDSFYMPQIEALFADHARFICLFRHGLDVVCSMDEFTRNMQVYIKELHDYVRTYPNPHVAFAHAWADVTTAILDFADNYPARCYKLTYENLVTNTAAELDELATFMNCAPFPDDPENALTIKNARGIGDWKAYKKSQIDRGSLSRWKTDLPAVTIETLAPIVNPVLTRLGYETVSAGSKEDQDRRQEIARMMMQGEDNQT